MELLKFCFPKSFDFFIRTKIQSYFRDLVVQNLDFILMALSNLIGYAIVILIPSFSHFSTIAGEIFLSVMISSMSSNAQILLKPLLPNLV